MDATKNRKKRTIYYELNDIKTQQILKTMKHQERARVSKFYVGNLEAEKDKCQGLKTSRKYSTYSLILDAKPELIIT